MSDKTVTIAVVAPQEPFEFFSDFWEGVWSAAYELAPLGVQVNNTVLENLNADQQARSVEELLRAHVDVIVLLPAESQRFDELIARHAQRGTAVVTVFNDAPLSRRVLFVGPDHRIAGCLAGQMLENVLRPGSHIVALTGLSTADSEGSGELDQQLNQQLNHQYQGFRAALSATLPPFTITEYDSAEALLTAMNSEGFSFDGLYVGCAESPLVGEILKRVRRPSRAVTFGLTEMTRPYLESGTLCAVIDSSRYYQGYLAVQKAYECVHAQSIESRWVSVPSSVMLPAHASADGQRASMHLVMETVLRQRTRQLQNYKKDLDLANARLMHIGETDPVTGLLNRRRFDEVLEEAVGGYIDGGSPVALLAIALDDARGIAALLGQGALDQAIEIVAASLRLACRPDDLLARTGPDEFAVLLLETPLAVAQGLSDRILDSVNGAHMAADADVAFSVSVGLAWAPAHGRTGAELKSAADDCLNRSSLRRHNKGQAAVLQKVKKVG